jgi:hemoglobin-like flavoprotein
MLADMLQGLGRRHVNYGVRDEHYEKVGQALIWMLENLLGDAFTAEARLAWTELYSTVAEAMKKAAVDHPAAPAVA